jgi:hypothetical protein
VGSKIQGQKLGDPNYKRYGLPISYRYKRDKKGWRVFVSVPVEHSKVATSTQQGVIGIDINANHLALTEIDRFGNPSISKSIPLNTYGFSSSNSYSRLVFITNFTNLIVSFAMSVMIFNSGSFSQHIL